MEQGKKLYVGNLNYNTSEDMLREVFSENGRHVAQVTIICDRETNQPRGFAFVEMESDKDAQDAIEALDGQELDGRVLVVNEAKDKPKRPDNRGGGGKRRPPRTNRE